MPRCRFSQCKTAEVHPCSRLIDSLKKGSSPFFGIVCVLCGKIMICLESGYKNYMQQVIKNAQAMAAAFVDRGYDLISGGTDNHLMLIDLRNKEVTGKLAEQALGRAHITINKNMVPFDTQSPFVTSGIRVGTAAVTTRGMKESDMAQIVDWIDAVICSPEDDAVIGRVGEAVRMRMRDLPLFAG